jgi:hypothetical protein
MILGPYRLIYDERRAKVEAAHSEYSKMRLHMDALRIMTKELLRDLLIAWQSGERGSSDLLKANATMAHAPSIHAYPVACHFWRFTVDIAIHWHSAITTGKTCTLSTAE